MPANRSPLAAIALLSLLVLPACSADDPPDRAEDPPAATPLSHGDASGDGCLRFPRTVGGLDAGFEAPESAYWDEGTEAWYVANMAGVPDEMLERPRFKDGRGWISKLDRCGNIVEAKWLSGMNAPKGIRVAQGKLYTSDMDELLIIDLATKDVRRIPALGAIFLNDLALAEDGTVYISDSFTRTVWRCKDEQCAPFFWSPLLNVPNGLLVDGDKLAIVTLGTFRDPASLGKVWMLDLESKELTRFGTLEAKLDGIERYRDGYLVSVNAPPAIYWVTATSSTLVRDFRDDGLTAINDLGLDPARRVVAVPAFFQHTVTLFRLPRNLQPR
ncbi:hypothetical protein WMF11_13280 [Sorangium sp. So ce295]|uniref:hypothetical protein n=1 Tax=Sorangium sp. So ce295 TaxID=3133295 RepID=UPI003F61AD44